MKKTATINLHLRRPDQSERLRALAWALGYVTDRGAGAGKMSSVSGLVQAVADAKLAVIGPFSAEQWQALWDMIFKASIHESTIENEVWTTILLALARVMKDIEVLHAESQPVPAV